MQAPPNGISFGLKPRQSKYGDGTFPCYSERADMRLIPRDHWVPVSLNRHVPLIYSQLDGMCTSNAATMAMQISTLTRANTIARRDTSRNSSFEFTVGSGDRSCTGLDHDGAGAPPPE